MSSPEVFYLHIQGEQRGPYTIPQIDHLLNSGLIAEETLYWREGLEQWAPVTSLVVKRIHVRQWGRLLVGAAIVATLGLFAAFFGPVVVEGWREANQHRFTPEAAYWRAREVVRSQALSRGALVHFADFSQAKVELQPPARAVVTLPAELVETGGGAQSKTWQVAMTFDEARAEWTGVPQDGAAAP